MDGAEIPSTCTHDHPYKSWTLPTRQQRPHHWLRSPGRRATNRQVRSTSSTTPITSSIHPAVLSATASDGLNQSRAGSRFITGSAMSPPGTSRDAAKPQPSVLRMTQPATPSRRPSPSAATNQYRLDNTSDQSKKPMAHPRR